MKFLTMLGCTDRRVAPGIRRTRAAAAGAGGGSPLSGRYPDDDAPAALIAPSPGRRCRPTRSGDPPDPWAASPTLQRSKGSESLSRHGGPELVRCQRRPGPSSPPLAAGRSPTASVGAWGQRPSPHAADRSPTAFAGAWGRSPSPPTSGQSPLAFNGRLGPESHATAAGQSPPAPTVTQPQPRLSTRAEPDS